MTEIEVEDIAGRLGQHFRRVFHAREGALELHLSILEGVAARYRTPLFSALKQYSHRPTGVFMRCPSRGASRSSSLAPTFLYFRTDANYCYVVIC